MSGSPPSYHVGCSASSRSLTRGPTTPFADAVAASDGVFAAHSPPARPRPPSGGASRVLLTPLVTGRSSRYPGGTWRSYA